MDILPPIISYFINLGLAGILILAFLFGWIYTGKYVDELKANHKAEVDELKQALALERSRNEVGEISGRILGDLAKSIRKELNP